MRERIRSSLTAKLFTAQLLVIVAGSLTLALIALTLAPGIFNVHLSKVPETVSKLVMKHIDSGFQDAILISLGIATLMASITALAVSWFLSRRVVTPIHELAQSAERISQGAYSERVPEAGTDELGALGRAFNEMATSLESVELRRRELLADIAHELRTPLSTIEGYLEGIADGVLAADEKTRSVLETEARRIGRLVDDLQKVSRAEARQLDLRLASTGPYDLLKAAHAAALPAYEAKGVSLDIEAGPGLPAINVDAYRMGEVLGNLLDNALRHTPREGRVVLSTHRRGQSLELSVSDSGHGIAPAELEKVFERFYRTDRARDRASGGSGIGLTIARAIVEAQGGTIKAESERAGHGARFTIAFPLAH